MSKQQNGTSEKVTFLEFWVGGFSFLPYFNIFLIWIFKINFRGEIQKFSWFTIFV